MDKIIGIGNALVDILARVDSDAIIDELQLFHSGSLFFVAAFEFASQVFHAQPFGGQQHNQVIYQV